MNYVDFKLNLKMALLGDRRDLPEDSDLKILLIQKLRVVAEKYEPRLLTTSKKNQDILKRLENGQYILVPSLPSDDSENIKMDEGLMYVVVYALAKQLGGSNKKDDYDDLMWEHILNYTWNSYESDFSKNDNKSSTDTNLDIYGDKKIYIDRTKSTQGYVYKWDEDFVSILNDYLLGKADYELSISDLKNIEKFVTYSKGNLDLEDEDYDAFKEINIYIGEL